MNPDEKHRAEFVRGLVSATSLAGLLLGVPILLIVGVGWPLPQRIPSGTEVATALKTGAIPPSLILKSISLVVWVLWLQMAAGVGIELWAHFHGRVAPRVGVIPLFIQRLSARMMGTALVVVFSIQSPGIAMADNHDLLTPTNIQMDSDQPWSFELIDTDGRAVPDPSDKDGPTKDIDGSSVTSPIVHIVEHRDSLRMLAERYLGDPDRWTEVFVLNQGQAQTAGGSLIDPARLQPGWELVMPVDARFPNSTDSDHETGPEISQEGDVPLPGLDSTRITVKIGDTLWGLADHHLNDPERWVDIFNSNQDIIQDPHVIKPGWQLQLPAPDPPIEIPNIAELVVEPLPKVESHPELVAESRPEAGSHAVPVLAFDKAKATVVARVAPSDTVATSAPTRQTMFAVGGLGVFATSLGWVLARLRRTQRRRLPNGRMPPPPTTETVLLEQQLQATSDPDSALFLDASLRVLSSRFADSPPPQIIGVSLDPHCVTVLLETPSEAPPGFDASDDRMAWKLSRDTDLEQLLVEADGVPAPVPTLVAIGQGDGQEFLLNLEHMAALRLDGDQEAINNLCSAIATQLASSHLADDLTVLCVGFGQDLRVFERVEYEADVDSAIQRIRQLQRQNRALFGNHPSPVDTRIGSSGDYWHPTVVLIPNLLSEGDASGLLELCGSSVCVVAHGFRGATWVGQIDEQVLMLQPIGLRLEPHGLSGLAASTVAELANSAKDAEGVILAMPPTPQPTQIADSASAVEPIPVDIEVQVMGTVEVLGAAQPFTSRRALDLVAYLAFHPQGADRDQLRAHIWPPDEPPTESALSNTICRARKALGDNDDGELYLPRPSPEGIYRLRPEVGTDVGRFEALVSAARSDSSESGREMLRSALEMLRGTPFTGSTGDMYRWADFGLRTHIECLVYTASHELATRCIEAEDNQGARKAVLTSLQLVGVCEECYRLRLLAAAENPTEVRKIMAELVNLLKRESNQPESDDLISPDVLELYERLMSSRAAFSF